MPVFAPYFLMFIVRMFLLLLTCGFLGLPFLFVFYSFSFSPFLLVFLSFSFSALLLVGVSFSALFFFARLFAFEARVHCKFQCWHPKQLKNIDTLHW